MTIFRKQLVIGSKIVDNGTEHQIPNRGIVNEFAIYLSFSMNFTQKIFYNFLVYIYVLNVLVYTVIVYRFYF